MIVLLVMAIVLLCCGDSNTSSAVNAASSPSTSVISSIQVSLKGKRYQVENVSTLAELQERLEEASGVPPSKQGRILFRGQTLSGSGSSNVALSEAGVQDGDVVNCVPTSAAAVGAGGKTTGSGKKKTKKSTTSSSSSSGSTQKKAASSTTTTTTVIPKDEKLTPPEDMTPDQIKASLKEAGIDTEMLDQANEQMKGMLQQAGVDPEKMEAMVQNMMGGAGGGGPGGGLGDLFGGMGGAGAGGAPSLEESMDLMSGMMNSPLISQFMNDPEKLEESRQMILKNPMMKSMVEMNPGMSQIINDPVAWREAMQAAAKMYQEMDKDDLLQAMKEGASAAAAGGGMPPGMPPGLFGSGSASSTTPSALDELDEDD